MGYFGTLDYTIIAFYFTVLISIGILLNRKASGSIEDYFLGGRRMPWYLLGFSGMAGWVNITGTMIIIAFIYVLGPRGLYIELRGGVGLILVHMLIWTGKWHRRSGCITGAEWMKFRFGDGPGAQMSRLVTVLAGMLATLGLLGLTIKGLGIFLSMFFPYPPAVCAVAFIIIVTFYTMLSGFYGVVFSDMFQTILVFIGTIGISIMAFKLIGTTGGFAETAVEVTGNADWMSSLPSWKTEVLPGYEMYEYLFLYASFALLNNLLGGFGSGGMQVYFGARNDRECGLLSAMWAMLMSVRWFLMMAIVVFGIYLVKELFPDQGTLLEATAAIKAQFGTISQTRWAEVLSDIANNPGNYSALVVQLENILGAGWADSIQMLGYHGNINPETLLPAVLLKCIPSGFRGIMFISLIAAAMSTFDSALNGSASLFTKDIYQNLIRPKASNREMIFASYGFIVFIVIVGYFFAFTLKSVNDIWSWLVMSLNAGLMAPVILRLYWWRFNGAGYAIGTGCGIFFATLQRLIVPDMNEIVQFVVIMTASFACTIVATLLTKPTPEPVLENFYRKTLPFGLWGPLKKKLPSALKKKIHREHRNDILALPFVALWQITMFMMAMQVIIKAYYSLAITGAIFLVSVVGMYIFWYTKLPKDNFYSDDDFVMNESEID